ncbi:MAG TPA: hypothetical protein VHS59_10210, partial [Bacillota bacterium]|nr:hypothetical protein [Bacillota bacterium]
MRSRKIRLRDLFKPQFMDKALALYGFERINNYPFLEEHLRRYLNTLRGASNFSLFNYGETYYEVIPLDADNFYEVCWNIPMARRLIMHHRLPRQEFLLGEIIDLVDRNCINTA